MPGTIVELHSDAESEEDKLINVAYFIGKEGEVLARYEKKNLWVRFLSLLYSFRCDSSSFG